MRLYKLRISLLSLICLALSFITCNDSDNIVQEEQINDVMTTMSDLMARYDANGNADESQNSSGNMAIDFCFESHVSFSNFTAQKAQTTACCS